MSSLDRFKRISILVGIPSRGEWEDKFGMSLLNMITYFTTVNLGYREQLVQPMNVRGSILPNQRLDIVKEARKSDRTHICFIDTDQTYPKNLLHGLLRHDKDVVACNIATKQIPSQPTARQFSLEHPYTGIPVYNNPKRGLEKVWRVGTGVMLIKTKVFDVIGLNVFGNPWIESAEKYQGEDWSLAEALEKNGIELFIDHEVSEYVKHVGKYEYDHDVVGILQQEKIANG